MRKIALCLALIIAALGLVGGSAHAVVIYNSIPDPYPKNIPSLGYQATSTQEFGNAIQFDGTARNLTSVTVALSDWALFSKWGTTYPSGYSHDFTLNLYNVGASGSNTPGSLIESLTTSAIVPLRPEVWEDGQIKYSGILFNVVFDASSLSIILPDEIVFGLAYNTETHGYTPLGAPGPYNSLNFGLNESAPSVGTDLNPDAVYWNTSHAGFYTDLGAAGVKYFREDTGWTGYTPAIMFNADGAPVATPEPGTMILMGVGVLGAVFMRRRSQKGN